MKQIIYIIGLVMFSVLVSANITLLFDYNTAEATGEIIYTTTNLTIYYVNGTGGIGNETDPIYSADRTELITNASNGQTAYGWGDHSLAGYLTLETDPKVTAELIENATNGSVAYSWGDHSLVGYFDNINDFTGTLTSGKFCTYDGTEINCTSDVTVNETDPIFSAIRAELTENATNGSVAYSWGDHALAGYITNETDPFYFANPLNYVNGTYINNSIANYLTFTYYNVSSYKLEAGTTTDDLADVLTYNESDMRISEKAGTPALDVRFNFTNVNDFSAIVLRLKTVLNTQPTTVELYNYDESSWESYLSYTTIDSYTLYTLSVFDSTEHIDNGTVQLRIYQAAAGNTNHKHDIEWITLIDGVTIFSSSEADPLSVHISDLSSDFIYDGTLYVNDSAINISESQIYDLQAYLTTELDPKVTAELVQNASEGATAYTWGDHAGLYAPIDGVTGDFFVTGDLEIGGGYGDTGVSILGNGSILIDNDILIGGQILTVQTRTVDGDLTPYTDNSFSLGNQSYRWKDFYVSQNSVLGNTYVTNLDVEQIDINYSIDGSSGAVIDFNNVGHAIEIYSPNNITITGQFIPHADNTYDIGKPSKEWKNGYFDGVIYTDELRNHGNIYIGESEANQNIYFYEDGTATGEAIYWDDTSDRFVIDDALYTNGGLTTNGNIINPGDYYTTGAGDNLWLGTSTEASALFHANAGGQVRVVNLTASNDVVTDQLYMGDYFYHTGDIDTYLYYESDIINVNAGGVEMLEFNEGTIDQIYVRSPLNFVVEPATDHEGNAIIIDGTAGATLAVGNLVYLKDDREWYKTDADAEATSINMLGIVYGGTCTDGNACSILTYGVFRDDSYAWTEEGEPMYLSNTAGNFNLTRPSGTGDYVRVVGYALTDDAVFFNPGSAWVVVP